MRYHPSLEEFVALSRQATLVPVYRQLDRSARAGRHALVEGQRRHEARVGRDLDLELA